MSATARRGLGPGAGFLSATVRAPRTPLPWSPAALDGELRSLLDTFESTATGWREAFEDLDEDVLAEAAAEGRIFRRDPAAAVDQLVADLIRQLADWDQALADLAHALTAATEGRPLPDWAADAGRTEDVRLRQARQALLEAVARHHHKGPAPVAGADRPW
ncbi:hypothetical protein P3T36_006315 [Kitasatospora sp. MAP12-15]|uniref:hypothetical protein n=1 Tax=unclassified Kitasatospora TaxID=2633591 RepID=UPI0024761B9A|nr:hypothetical protein [Kitasatospora sp. MAP12-44]MDH6107856.1 hypothetical protein [Kitasatospora sp. MAP12-44]